MKEEFKAPDLAKLGKWFSVARVGRYAGAPDPAALYVWDARLQRAFLEDISCVEVLLRNFISERLAAAGYVRTPESSLCVACVRRGQ